ncbi:MAG: rhodanese-like domain-containing protein [Bacteroidales bacterium]|nr:rhodanese-like domain-containing protein [Bacteroidales bacterium]
MKIKYLLTCLALMIMISCQAQSEFKSVGIDEFKTEISKSGVQLVDVRTAQEYSEGHIPGAMNIDVNAPDFEEKIKALDKKENVAIYCRSGRRSKTAANKMTAAGFKVIELNTGFLSWDGTVEK